MSLRNSKLIGKLKKVDNVHIGIVGGSNLNKQIEQLGPEIIDQFKWVFSENGLVAFENGKMFHSNSILDTLGDENNMANVIKGPKLKKSYVDCSFLNEYLMTIRDAKN